MSSTDGTEVLKTRLTPVIPDEADGFAVKVGMGPYPPDRPRSRQRAVYAELRPVSAHARGLMLARSRERVLGMIPLTELGAAEIAANPSGSTAERAAGHALQAALRLARG